MGEQIYDSEVAPLLAAAAKICGDTGMSFIAVVQYDDDGRGITKLLGESPSAYMRSLAMLAHAKGNIDAFLLGLIREAKDGRLDLSNSIFLREYAKGGQQ